MRSATIAVLVVLLSGPAWADEGPEHLHHVPLHFKPIPMPRAAFDRAAKSMYWKSCDCLRYLEEGVVRETPLPLDNRERWRLFDRILRGLVIPLGAPGEES